MDRRDFLRGSTGMLAAASLLRPAAVGAAGRAPHHTLRAGHGRHSGPRRGGSLRVAVEAEENSLDPTGANWDATGVLYARAFYDPLAATASDGSVKPYLAQSITPNADFSAWTIVARPGVNFHDGTLFDADAMLANFKAQLDSYISGQVLQGMVRDVVKVDAMSVTIAMNSPWVPFDSYLAGFIGGQFAYMASPRALAAGSLQDHPVGTGPFVFQSWEPNDHLSGARNPDYWRSGMPYVDEVSFHPIIEDQSRFNSLRAGNIDILHTTDVANYLTFRHDPSLSTVDNLKGEVGDPDQDFIMLNLAQPPLDDLRIRQAIAYATDARAYNKVENNGATPIDFSPFAKGSPSYSDTGYPRFNLAKARDLVRHYQSDHPGPVVINLGDVVGTGNTTVMNLIAQMWSKAGLTIHQQQIQQSKYISDALLGNYGANLWRQFGATDPDQNFSWWSSTKVQPIGGISLNFARNKDPQIDAALTEGRQNPDPAARAAAYRSVSARLNADVPYIWQNRALWAVVARKSVKGYNSYTLPDGSTGLGAKSGTFPIVNAWLS